MGSSPTKLLPRARAGQIQLAAGRGAVARVGPEERALLVVQRRMQCDPLPLGC